VEPQIELTEHEIEFLKKIHVARCLQEMTNSPGWPFYTEVIDMMLQRVKQQHLQFAAKASRDAYWLSGARLNAVEEFAIILKEQITGQIDLLNQPLRLPNRNGFQPEGE